MCFFMRASGFIQALVDLGESETSLSRRDNDRRTKETKPTHINIMNESPKYLNLDGTRKKRMTLTFYV